MSVRRCPALLVTAPASGQGKTTLTAALARLHCRQGRRVRVMKTGPDFLDPMILQRASRGPVYQLDLWMGGETHCRQLLHDAAGTADLILIEGVMGLYDGNPSSADLAQRFGIPLLGVIDGSAMAQTFGAIALGLTSYRSGLEFAGVFANRVGSTAHAEMLSEALPKSVRFLGALPRDSEISLPDRHLGLAQAAEIEDLDARLDRAAGLLEALPVAHLPDSVIFDATETAVMPDVLRGCRIAVARDAAFSFLYQANLDLLQSLGAQITFFSPLADEALPEADSLYLPGGYPELHLETLAHNRSIQSHIAAHHAQGKPIVAECGGMLYLLEYLTDANGNKAHMVGLLPGHALMQTRLTNLGLQEMTLPEGKLRGHTFHYSRMETSIEPLNYASDSRTRGRGEPVFRQGRLHASYVHAYLPSNPQAAGQLFLP